MSTGTFLVIALPGFVFLIVASVAAFMIVDAIRSRHADIWKSLGEPSYLFLQIGFSHSSREMQRYILSGDFRELDDRSLNMLCNVYRASLVIALLLIASIVGLGSLGILK